MTDYWKSNERKYCDYCACWIADNKSSIVFHEGGKKHKANVAKKLVEIGRKSEKDAKERQKVDQQIRQMEDAALKAYAQDIARGGDISTQEMNASVAAATAAFEEQSTASSSSSSRQGIGPSAMPPRKVDPMLQGLPEDFLEIEEKAKRAKQTNKRAAGDGSKEQSMWVEAVTDEGYSYYWNVKSGESIWEPPKEGFMTVEEYNKLDAVYTARAEKEMHEETKYITENADELASKYRRQQMRAIRTDAFTQEAKEKEVERESYTAIEEEEPGPSASQPYGKWQTVVHVEEKHVDLQLPVSKHEFQYVPTITSEAHPPPREFKEKIISSLDDDDTTVPNTFKKRKIANNKRNARQRVNDDD